MIRKKSSLWLNKTNRRKNEENRVSSDWSTKIFQTPQKSKCVQFLTPIRLTRGSPSPLKRKPKRQRIYSPIIVQYDSEYTYIITKNSSSQTDDVREMYCNNTYCNLFGQVIEKLSTQDKSKCNEIIQFLQLLKDDKYPLENIAFLLFLETVRFLVANIRQKCLTD